jgi:hypothetical protein
MRRNQPGMSCSMLPEVETRETREVLLPFKLLELREMRD